MQVHRVITRGPVEVSCPPTAHVTAVITQGCQRGNGYQSTASVIPRKHLQRMQMDLTRDMESPEADKTHAAAPLCILSPSVSVFLHMSLAHHSESSRSQNDLEASASTQSKLVSKSAMAYRPPVCSTIFYMLQQLTICVPFLPRVAAAANT